MHSFLLVSKTLYSVIYDTKNSLKTNDTSLPDCLFVYTLILYLTFKGLFDLFLEALFLRRCTTAAQCLIKLTQSLLGLVA